jgi:trimeric autotransporter adhesin
VGNIYVTDNIYYIRKVNTSGIISTIAGNGKLPAPGEGTPALSTGMGPIWVAVDGAGNLYYAEPSVGRVRQINTSGIVNTVARQIGSFNLGDGGPATSAYLENPTGVAVDNSGNIYIADSDQNRVRKVTGVAAPGNAGSGSVTGAAPEISTNGVVNGASFGSGLVVGSWATIQGTNFAASTGEWDVVNGILPITVGRDRGFRGE